MAAAQVRRLEELRQRWARRRRKEMEDLQAARASCEEVRQHHAALWQECQKRRAKLAQVRDNVLGAAAHEADALAGA